MEGYGSIVKGAARKAATSLTSSIEDFVPEFENYRAGYAMRSKPLEALSTRLGKLVEGTEGGIKGDAYHKTPNATLPNRFFSNKEGVDLLVETLGKKRVDELAMNYILENTAGKSTEAKLTAIKSPQTRAML